MSLLSAYSDHALRIAQKKKKQSNTLLKNQMNTFLKKHIAQSALSVLRKTTSIIIRTKEYF